MMDVKSLLIDTPPLNRASSRAVYLEQLRTAVAEQLRVDLSIDELGMLYDIAAHIMHNMDDIFWDVDDHEPCAYCHHEFESECPRAGLPSNDCDDGCPVPWYGACASERMLNLQIPYILDALIPLYVMQGSGLKPEMAGEG